MARKIVIVEDNPADAKILRVALASADPSIETILLEHGAKAIELFTHARESNELPVCDLILLDLNLPRISGFEVLEFLKSDPELRKTPVIVTSGSGRPLDVDRCYASFANSYICKPVGIDEVFNFAAGLVGYWFHNARLPFAQDTLRAGI